MFDISFGELALIGLVALVVLGPERLPKVARTAGLLLGRMQRYVADVKADINREIQLDELKKLQHQMEHSAREMESSLSAEMRALEASLQETAKDATQGIKEAAAGVSSEPAVEPPMTLAAPADEPAEKTGQGAQMELAIEPAKEKA